MSDNARLPLPWTGGSTIRRREQAAAPAPRWYHPGPSGWTVIRVVRNTIILLLPVTAWLVPPPQTLFPREPRGRLARHQPLGLGPAYAGGDIDADAGDYGRELFQQSCAACHGSEGQGLPHQGVALRTSSFVSARGDDELLQFLRTGRQPRDPHSQLGLVMPARGAPPLSDAQLARVLSFLRALQRQNGTDGGGSSASAREVGS
jgi:mono/diheme cytochrome c family protein